MFRKIVSRIAFLIAACFLVSSSLIAQTETVTTASSQLQSLTSTILLPVDDINNAADPSTHFGHVAEAYQMGIYDVTANDYSAFLNAVASTSDIHGLYNPKMATDADVACIDRKTNDDGTLSYSIIEDNKNRGLFPITYVSWRSAARFCNWLQNGALTYDQIADPDQVTETGAYDLADSTSGVVSMNKSANYFLPNENQWYKAAYYHAEAKDYYGYATKSYYIAPGNTIPDPSGIFITADQTWDYEFNNQANYMYGIFSNTYATGTAPYLTSVGSFFFSPAAYGMFDMGGNVWQWTSSTDEYGNCAIRGGSWRSQYSSYAWIKSDLSSAHRKTIDPATESSTIGFRIAGPAVPTITGATETAADFNPLNHSEAFIPPQLVIALILALAALLVHYASSIMVGLLVLAAILFAIAGFGIEIPLIGAFLTEQGFLTTIARFSPRLATFLEGAIQTGENIGGAAPATDATGTASNVIGAGETTSLIGSVNR